MSTHAWWELEIPKEPPEPPGLCQCGCGQETRIYPQGRPGKNIPPGGACKYVAGHHPQVTIDIIYANRRCA